ncbi:MAG: hypothetical protein IKA07_04775 [Alistipes sp.]|nr:hypothetical protein [Alistipes sp.]
MKKLFIMMLLCATMAYFPSCEKEGPTLGKSNYTLRSEESTTIEGMGLSGVVWSSNNEFVATAENDVLTSNKVGSTTLSCGDAVISVTVKPRYTLYNEPYVSWGCSISSIKSQYGQPYSETDTSLIYQTANSAAPLIIYMFENNCLTSYGVVVPLSYGDILVDFIAERYVIVAVEGTTATFVHAYGKFSDPQIDYWGQMAYSNSIEGFIVMYVPYNNTSNSAD